MSITFLWQKMQMNERIVNSDASLEAAIQHLRDQYAQYKYVTVSLELGRQVSHKQKGALHLYCKWLSAELNERGLSANVVMDSLEHEGFDIPWDDRGEMVKRLLWKPIQLAMFGKESTQDAFRTEYPQVYDTLTSKLIDSFNVCVPWPSVDSGQRGSGVDLVQ